MDNDWTLGELFECWSFLGGTFVHAVIVWGRRVEENENNSQCGNPKLMG